MGKTAFMESCFLIQNAFSYPSPENREQFYLEIIKWLIILEENRKTVDFLIEWIKDEYELIDFSQFEIHLPKKFILRTYENSIIPENSDGWNYGSADLAKYRENKHFYQIYKKNNPPQIQNTIFITPYTSNHSNIKDMVDTTKLDGNYDYVNKFLKEIFDIEKIDIIKNKVMVQQNNIFQDLNDFGDGLKHFLHIVLALLVNKNNVIYLDEIENGIHYTNLDKLWEIILAISKEQNVQVFATTHSKECIESYARVAKKLEETDIKFLSLYRNKENVLKSITFDYEKIQDRIELGLDNR